MADEKESDFADAVEEAKKIEKKIFEYKPYDGVIDIRKDVELYPAEYVDVDYSDLINLYERSKKIISASKMRFGSEAPAGAEEIPTEEKRPISESEAKKIEEVESNVRNITSEALKKAEEIAATGKMPAEAGTGGEKPRPPPHLEIELEKKKPEEYEIPSELELEFGRTEKEKEEEKKLQVPMAETAKTAIYVPEKEFPSTESVEDRNRQKAAEEADLQMQKIMENPDEAAEKKYKQIEDEVVSTLGEKADETAIKKKMLELTKQLFKEKSFDRREAIKHEIAALKNILISGKTELGRKVVAKTKKTKKTDDESVAHMQVMQTLISTQSSEMTQTKDSITNSYKHKIDALHDKFHEDIGMAADDAEKKKKLYDTFVFELTKLSEQLPETIEKFRIYTTKKHLAELTKISKSISPNEKDVALQIDKKLKAIDKEYAGDFSNLQDIISKRIDSLIRASARDVFEKGSEELTHEGEGKADVDEIISEINNIDAGTLLYYLHSHDQEYYKKYERKHISMAEAITRARILMAKKKGLNANIIKKYFGTLEG